MSTAWVTYAKNNDQALHALNLCSSIKATNTKHKVHLFYTTKVSAYVLMSMKPHFDDMNLFDLLDLNNADNLPLVKRPDLVTPFTTLQCFCFIQYTKAVFVHPRCYFHENADELFSLPIFAAAPDVAFPDMFDLGVFVYTPCIQTYRELVNLAVKNEPFATGAQGILNAYYHTWSTGPAASRLSLDYNLQTNAYHPRFTLAKIVNTNQPAGKPWIIFDQNENLKTWCKQLHDRLTKKFAQFLSEEELDAGDENIDESEQKAKKTCLHEAQFYEEFLIAKMLSPEQYENLKKHDPNFLETIWDSRNATPDSVRRQMAEARAEDPERFAGILEQAGHVRKQLQK